jgi:hypothetical protein
MSYTNGLDKPSDYFNTKLYTGNNSTNAITGVGFQPDWTWIKPRNGTDGHVLFDSVRGVLKRLRTEGTNAEDTLNNSLTSFDTDGFTLGSSGEVNSSSYNLVSWNWLASNTTVSNTDGSITSTVSANTTSGFSIVSYTGNGTAGATIGHSLGATPNVVLVKQRNASNNWMMYHSSLGNTGNMRLNDTNAFAVDTTYWNDTSPNSTTFTLGTDGKGNGSGNTYIAYCFAEKKGFSKFGSYTGNGSADGTFIYTGFKPAWILIKRSSGIGDWQLIDNKRSTFNVCDKRLQPNNSDAEAGSDTIDICSNGFKNRNTFTNFNGSGSTYIYMCFAENPLVSTAGVPCTAR